MKSECAWLWARGASDVLRLVVGAALRMAAIGLGIGLVLAVLLTRALSSALFGVVRIDVLTISILTSY